MIRFNTLAALLILFMVPTGAHAEWKLRQEYTDGSLTVVSVSGESQVMPVGLRDAYTASLTVSCLPESRNMWLQLVWPEQMTGSKTITIVRTVMDFPELPQEWQASQDGGDLQSFTLDTQTIMGTELINRMLNSKSGSLALRPQGNGRIQNALFPLAGLDGKLREVIKSCPQGSYFDTLKADKGQ
jgi:hypothetical protein